MPDASMVSANAEAEQLLTGMARGRFGRIAPERIARHLLAAFPDADWPARKAAFDALARRFGFAQRDGLRVAERPDSTLGSYRTLSTAHKPKGRGAQKELGPRPYETAIYRIEPLRMSCACADFVRSSLGLCKHGLIVLETLEQQGVLGAAADGGGVEPSKPWLGWACAHPASGSPDRLARLAYNQVGKAAAPSGFDARGTPSESALRDPESRLAWIDELERGLRSGRLLAEPAVPTLLHEERARAARRRDARALLPAARKSLSGLGRKLYPYQREGVLRFFETGRLLLADDMGLGKTTQAIAICHALLATDSIQRGLLIVPSPLKAQWKREWEATTDAPLTLVEGSPKERKQLYERTRSGVLIIGYEQLLRDLEHVLRFAPELVVLDEAQRIKNWATKSAAYVKSLEPAYRLVLTGTPMENRFDELASIMDFVDDIALEPKWRLVPFHSVVSEESGRGSTGARNLSVLRERLSTAMLRRVRQEVLTQLPARTDTRVPVELTEVQQQQHDELRQPIAAIMAKAQRRPLQQGEFMQLMQLLTKQRMICNGMAQVQFESEWPRCEHVAPTPAVLESLFTPKLSVLRGLVEQVVLEQGRKAVVFSQWRKMLCFAEWAVRDLLSAAGMRALFFTGAETPKAREQAIRDFNEDPRATLLFLSDAGGVGLNLQHAASCCINLELPWNPAVLEQRIGRVYRLGQKLPIDVYNLVADDGIEGRIAQVIAQKKAVFSSLFDGTSDEVLWDGETSFLESVKKLVDPVLVPAAAVGLEDMSEPEPTSLPLTAAEPELPPVSTPASLPGMPGLQVTRLPDGGVRIEASAALAQPLAELLEQLAKTLRPSGS